MRVVPDTHACKTATMSEKGAVLENCGRQIEAEVMSAEALVRVALWHAIAGAREKETEKVAAVMLIAIRTDEDCVNPRSIRFEWPLRCAEMVGCRVDEWAPIRWNDTIFAIVGTGYASARCAVQRAREIVRQLRTVLRGCEASERLARIDVALASYPEDGESPCSLISAATSTLASVMGEDSFDEGHDQGVITSLELRVFRTVSDSRTESSPGGA